MRKEVVTCRICGLTFVKEKLNEHLRKGHEGNLVRVEGKFSITYETQTGSKEVEKLSPVFQESRKPRTKKKRTQNTKASDLSTTAQTRSQATGHSRIHLRS